MTRNKRYIKEEKKKLLARMLSPERISPTNLSIETGIIKSTLATWKAKATQSEFKKTKSTNKISSKEKFIIAMEKYTLSEFELSKYCREHVLYAEEVTQWRSSCISSNDGFRNNKANLEEELKEEKKKSKELSKDLRKKL